METIKKEADFCDAQNLYTSHAHEWQENFSCLDAENENFPNQIVSIINWIPQHVDDILHDWNNTRENVHRFLSQTWLPLPLDNIPDNIRETIHHPILLNFIQNTYEINLTQYDIAQQVHFIHFLYHSTQKTFSQLQSWIVHYGEGFLNAFMEVCDDIQLGNKLIEVAWVPWMTDFNEVIHNVSVWRKWFDRNNASYEHFWEICVSHLNLISQALPSQQKIVLEDGWKHLRTFFRKINLGRDVTLEEFNDNDMGYRLEQIWNGDILSDTEFSDIFNAEKYRNLDSFWPHHLKVVMEAIFTAFHDYGSFFCYKVFTSFWTTIVDEYSHMFVLKNNDFLLGTIGLKKTHEMNYEVGNFYINIHYKWTLGIGWILDHFAYTFTQHEQKGISSTTLLQSTTTFRNLNRSALVGIEISDEFYWENFISPLLHLEHQYSNEYQLKNIPKTSFLEYCWDDYTTENIICFTCDQRIFKEQCEKYFQNGFCLVRWYIIWGDMIAAWFETRIIS